MKLTSAFIIKRLIMFSIITSLLIFGVWRYIIVSDYTQKHGIPFRGVDFLTLKEINENYAVDKKYAFYQGARFAVDRATFEVVDVQHAKDRYTEYFGTWSNEQEEQYKQESFNRRMEHFTKDFYKSKESGKIYYKGHYLFDVDPDTFSVIDDYYVKDHQYIYLYNYSISDQGAFKKADVNYESFESIGYLYAKDKDYLYYKDRLVEGVDPKNFASKEEIREIINSQSLYDYVRDNQYVYYQGRLVNNADPNTYEYIVGGMKAYAYFAYDQKRSTMHADDIYITKDKNYVYYANSILPLANPKTFEIISGGYNEKTASIDRFVSRDNEHVYYQNMFIKQADPESFEFLTEHYAKDKNHVYYLTRSSEILEGADPKLLPSGPTYSVIDHNRQDDYITNGINIFYRGHPLKDADLKTFKIITGDYNKVLFARDKERIYHHQHIIEQADPSSFMVINDRYSKDNRYVYFNYKLLQNSHAKSFRIINPLLSQDENNAYLLINKNKMQVLPSKNILAHDFVRSDDLIYYIRAGKVHTISTADTDSFKVLNKTYAIDKDNVYYILSRKYSPIEGADPKSFMVLNQYIQKDKNYIYLSFREFVTLGEKENKRVTSHLVIDKKIVDLPSFTQINNYLYKDKHNVYALTYEGLKRLEGADPESFTVTNKETKDKNNSYIIKMNGCGELISIQPKNALSSISKEGDSEPAYMGGWCPSTDEDWDDISVLESIDDLIDLK